MSTPLDLFLNLYLQDMEPYMQPDETYILTKKGLQDLAEKAYLEGNRVAPPTRKGRFRRTPEQKLEDERIWDLQLRRERIDGVAMSLARTPYVFKQTLKISERSIKISDIPMSFPDLLKKAAEYLDTLEAFVK